jgi:hypothetical protein
MQPSLMQLRPHGAPGTGRNYIYVSGFEVRDTNSMLDNNPGFGVLGNNDTLSDMNVHNAYQAVILVTGDYATVEYSTIWENACSNCRATGCPTPSSTWAQGVAVEGESANRTQVGGINAGMLTTSYFKLQSSSPANGAGESLSPIVTTAAFGHTRHSIPTIGAYETS